MRQALKIVLLAVASLLAVQPLMADGLCASNACTTRRCAADCCAAMDHISAVQPRTGLEISRLGTSVESACGQLGCGASLAQAAAEPLALVTLKTWISAQPAAISLAITPVQLAAGAAVPSRFRVPETDRYLLLHVLRI